MIRKFVRGSQAKPKTRFSSASFFHAVHFFQKQALQRMIVESLKLTLILSLCLVTLADVPVTVRRFQNFPTPLDGEEGKPVPAPPSKKCPNGDIPLDGGGCPTTTTTTTTTSSAPSLKPDNPNNSECFDAVAGRVFSLSTHISYSEYLPLVKL